MSDVIIRPLDLDKDAEGLAAIWNASDLQWPNSWTEGVPVTAEMVREEAEEWDTLAVYIAEVDGEIAGYCSFTQSDRALEDAGYLGLLNVHPSYQGRSIGRRLIQATIERSVEMGWQRQSLGTWSANYKAMPAYKKTGHFWMPDTSVSMPDYIPGALQLSLAKPFFERHDWYACYVREVTQEEDDQRWEGLKVFTQHWEAGGESLTVWIDREACGPVAIETDDVQVAAIAEEIEPLAGSAVKLRWRVINKSQQPLHIYLHAQGDKGLEIDHRDAWVVEGGATTERTAEVKVSLDAPHSRDDGTAPRVCSIIRLNEDEVELFSGMRARKPLSLDTTPADITVHPGAQYALRLQLHSELERPVDATLYLTPPEGMTTEWRQRQVTLPAKGHITVLVTTTYSVEAVYALPVRVVSENAGIKPLSETVTIFALGAGGLLVDNQQKSVRLETDTLRVTVEAKEGAIRVEHKDTRLTMVRLGPSLGPPFYPSEFLKKEFSLKVEERGSRAVVRMAAEAKRYPGLFLHQQMTLSSTGLMDLRYYLENRGSEPQTRVFCLHLQRPDQDKLWATLPLPAGVVRSHAAAYPVAHKDAPHDPAAYSEPWNAWECEGAVAGIAWGPLLAKIEYAWGIHLESVALSAKPGERSQGVSVAVYAGSGNWQAVRENALRWANLWQPEKEPPAVRSPALARLDPATLVTVSDETKARLVVDTVSNRAMSGQVALNAGDGLTVNPDCLPITDLTRDRAVERAVALSLPKDALGVYDGQVRLSLPLWEEETPFHVVRLGTKSPVVVTEDGMSGQTVWTVDNGLCQFIVAPGFGPSLISWIYLGKEQLHSNFPEPQGFSWLYPWFGGIHSLLSPAGSHVWEGYLHKEQVSAQAIEVRDASGIAWTGVRLSVRPKKKELADVRVEVDYLTLGGAKALKYVYRLHNLRDTEQVFKTGSNVTCRLGAEPEELVLRGGGVTHRPSPWGTSVEGNRWGALTNEGTGRTLLMVSDSSDVLLHDAGIAGRVLGANRQVRLASGETCACSYHLVLAESLKEALDYLVLKDDKG